MDLACARAVSSAAVAAAQNPATRVVFVEGAGGDFCRGVANGFEPLDCGLDPAADLSRLTVPVVAALGGITASAGLELALAADLRIAASDAVLSMRDLNDGRLPCWGGTVRLVRCAGPAVATRMLLTGEEVTAEQALAAGLVHEIVEPGRLAARATQVCERLAALAPLALAFAKEAIAAGAHLAVPDGLRLEADLNVLLQTSTDRAEGLRAFLSKRDPYFTGD